MASLPCPLGLACGLHGACFGSLLAPTRSCALCPFGLPVLLAFAIMRAWGLPLLWLALALGLARHEKRAHGQGMPHARALCFGLCLSYRLPSLLLWLFGLARNIKGKACLQVLLASIALLRLCAQAQRVKSARFGLACAHGVYS